MPDGFPWWLCPFTSRAAHGRMDSSHPGGCEVVSPAVLTCISLSRCLLGTIDASLASCVGLGLSRPLSADGTVSAITHTWVQMGERIRERYSGKPRNQGLTRCQLVTRSAILPPRSIHRTFLLIKSRPHFTAVRTVLGDICPCLETFLIVMTGGMPWYLVERAQGCCWSPIVSSPP